jgi:hypothetical protein
MLLSIVSEELLTSLLGAGLGAAAFAMIAGMAMILLIVFLVVYVFSALVMSTIARKLGYNKPWLAWIPIANLFLIPILADYKWWWGFTFVLPFVLGMIPLVGLVLNPIASVFSAVMSVIWYIKIFKKRNYSPWLILLFLVPIANIVMLCLLAWKDKE